MRDIVFVAVALAFFGLCYLYVLGCDRLIGRDTPATGTPEAQGSGSAVTDGANPAVTS
jgi:hypothetical protein